MAAPGEVFSFRVSVPLVARCDFCGGNVEFRGYIYSKRYHKDLPDTALNGVACETCNKYLTSTVKAHALQKAVLLSNYMAKIVDEPDYWEKFKNAVDAAKVSNTVASFRKEVEKL